MAIHLTNDDLKKELLKKINKELISKNNEDLKAFIKFNEAFSKASGSRNDKTSKTFWGKFKDFSSKESGSKNNEDLNDFTEKLKESFQKDTSDKSSLKFLLEELLNESSNRIDHLEKLKEKKIALLKSI